MMKTLGVLALASFSSIAFSTALYGVSRDGERHRFVSINTTTGAATTLFGFTLPGTISSNALSYNPIKNVFLLTAYTGFNSSSLVEIDAVSQTISSPLTFVPTGFMEGHEYNSALGGVVVSYGANAVTGKLALLDASTYALIGNNASTGLQDGDTLFNDASGNLNVMDTNNPTGGFQRNIVNNPFGVSSLTGVGSNFFGGSDFDLAYKADESKLFVTSATALHVVNNATNAQTTVGSFGAGYNIVGIAVAPVPEPASVLGLAAGAALILRRKRS